MVKLGCPAPAAMAAGAGKSGSIDVIYKLLMTVIVGQRVIFWDTEGGLLEPFLGEQFNVIYIVN